MNFNSTNKLNKLLLKKYEHMILKLTFNIYIVNFMNKKYLFSKSKKTGLKCQNDLIKITNIKIIIKKRKKELIVFLFNNYENSISQFQDHVFIFFTEDFFRISERKRRKGCAHLVVVKKFRIKKANLLSKLTYRLKKNNNCRTKVMVDKDR
ncbi:hypothetical protein BpHYR1_020850 [Brachionus plicatilis]|uniref:Uncharacterized protein n=1 Tax=Brachionus plicatilis TaxID=10195 RepID=A0A3M7R2K5_BRAPC|nr:hypothetical protein BpHYR1_020850 [Brachionus plicatilis]